MVTKYLFTNCDEDKLLVNCYEAKLLVDDGKMQILYTWAAPYIVETGTSFLDHTVGWWCQESLGPAPYMYWNSFSITDYKNIVCVEIDKSLEESQWTESTTITLAAAWYATASYPDSVTITVSYKGDTQSCVAYPGIKTDPFLCTPYSTDPVGTITVFDDGTFTLDCHTVYALIYHYGDHGEGSPDFPFFTRYAPGPRPLVMNPYTRDGYVFAGWNTASDGSGTPYADGAIYPYDAPGGNIWGMWTPSP